MLTCPHCQAEHKSLGNFCPTCGQALRDSVVTADEESVSNKRSVVPQAISSAPPDDPHIGVKVADRYRIVDRIAHGGMGTIYLAQQQMGTTQRYVAIKTLAPRFAADDAAARRFERECEMVSQLHHPNTVRVFDYGRMDDKTPYFVMEHINGESLESVIADGPIPLARLQNVVRQIAGSLHEAHLRGIVHRDLKPNNVLLTRAGVEDDVVKVLDFGIAKQAGGNANTTNLTEHGTLIGTPMYMSPEQFRMDELAPTSDVYSLGVLVYEALTGRLPFEATGPWDWANQHLTAEPIDIRDQPGGADLPSTAVTVVMSALRKDPTTRPASVLEFSQRLLGDPSATGSFPSVPWAAKQTRDAYRRRIVLGGVSLLLIALACLGVWSLRATPSDNSAGTAAEPSASATATVTPPTALTVEAGTAVPAMDYDLARVDAVLGVEPEVFQLSDDSEAALHYGEAPAPTVTPATLPAGAPTSTPTSATRTAQASSSSSDVDAAHAAMRNALKRGNVQGALLVYANLRAQRASTVGLESIRLELNNAAVGKIRELVAQQKCKNAVHLYMRLKEVSLETGARMPIVRSSCKNHL